MRSNEGRCNRCFPRLTAFARFFGQQELLVWRCFLAKTFSATTRVYNMRQKTNPIAYDLLVLFWFRVSYVLILIYPNRKYQKRMQKKLHRYDNAPPYTAELPAILFQTCLILYMHWMGWLSSQLLKSFTPILLTPLPLDIFSPPLPHIILYWIMDRKWHVTGELSVDFRWSQGFEHASLKYIEINEVSSISGAGANVA